MGHHGRYVSATPFCGRCPLYSGSRCCCWIEHIDMCASTSAVVDVSTFGARSLAHGCRLCVIDGTSDGWLAQRGPVHSRVLCWPRVFARHLNRSAGRFSRRDDAAPNIMLERERDSTASAKRRLAAQGARLRRVNAFKKELLSTLAHNLKNPLTVIVGRIDLLLRMVELLRMVDKGSLLPIGCGHISIGSAPSPTASLRSWTVCCQMPGPTHSTSRSGPK